MQLLGAALVLINICIIVVPIAGAVVLYRDNLPGLVVPVELNEIMDEGIFDLSEFALPQLVNYTYDQLSRTVTIVFNFTNPVNLNVTINSLAADVECNEHSVTLGHVGIASPVDLDMGVTAYVTAVFSWTTEAESHFAAQHAGQPNISISLENIVLDVSGIIVEAPTSYDIGNIPIPQVP